MALGCSDGQVHLYYDPNKSHRYGHITTLTRAKRDGGSEGQRTRGSPSLGVGWEEEMAPWRFLVDVGGVTGHMPSVCTQHQHQRENCVKLLWLFILLLILFIYFFVIQGRHVVRGA
jgi:hypothetical protein